MLSTVVVLTSQSIALNSQTGQTGRGSNLSPAVLSSGWTSIVLWRWFIDQAEEIEQVTSHGPGFIVGQVTAVLPAVDVLEFVDVGLSEFHTS